MDCADSIIGKANGLEAGGCPIRDVVCKGVSNVWDKMDSAGACIAQRTDVEKQAAMQEMADGKDGCCNYCYAQQSFCCAKRGFICVDDRYCEARRMTEQREEDEHEERQKQKWRQNKKIAISGTLRALAAVFGYLIVLSIERRCQSKRREENARAQDGEAGLEMTREQGETATEAEPP